jgi:hypothetical protein
MTNPFPGAPGPVSGAAGHVDETLLAGYAAGQVGEAVAWSVEGHLVACAACRSALSPYVDAGRLARNRAVLLARAAIGDGGLARRLMRRCGVPDYLITLLAATPSLRRSWLLSVAGVLAVVTGEAALVRYVFNSGSVGGYPGQEILVPFILLAPLLALGGVAAAFVPLFDPAYRLAVAAPFSGFTLLLARAISALATAMIPVACAAFLAPGPGWLPAAFLLPSLAVCAIALAAVTVVGPLAATIGAGALWALPVLWLTVTHLPLTIVEWHGQAASGVALLAAAAVLLFCHDRFEFGWTPSTRPGIANVYRA